MKIFKTGFKKWQNRHEIFEETISDLYQLGNEPNLGALDGYNDTTNGIQQLILQAINSNLTLRALGSGWSWTKIATVKNGLMLDTKPLNTLFTITPESVAATYTGESHKLFFAQCGNGVWELSKLLQARNLSLKTSGASNGQTIAGVIGTGAHGSAFDVGAVQDYVVGLHIITGADKHVWLERKSAPVVAASFINKLKTKLIQDDDLFNAALVSFGSFGIIHGVMIEAEDIFLLEGYLQRMPYDDDLKHMMETLDFSNAHLPCGNERPFHFSSYINPYDLAKGAYVTTMYKRPYTNNYKKPVPNAAGIGPGDDAPCFIGKLTQVIPALVPIVVNKLLSASIVPYNKQMGTIGEIFSNTTLHGKLLSAAIGIPIEFVNKVAELLIAINKTDGPFVGLFAFRYIKKSAATLAFTRYKFTCVCELDGAFSDQTYSFYKAVWKKLEDDNIPFTFHWGKVNELDPVRIQKMYGADATAWIAARNKLLDKNCLKVFTNPILTQWGLDEVLS